MFKGNLNLLPLSTGGFNQYKDNPSSLTTVLIQRLSQSNHSLPLSHRDWFRNECVRLSGQWHIRWYLLGVFWKRSFPTPKTWPEEMPPLSPDQWYANRCLKLPQTFHHPKQSGSKDKAKPKGNPAKLFIRSEPLAQSQPEARPISGLPMHWVKKYS